MRRAPSWSVSTLRHMDEILARGGLGDGIFGWSASFGSAGRAGVAGGAVRAGGGKGCGPGRWITIGGVAEGLLEAWVEALPVAVALTETLAVSFEAGVCLVAVARFKRGRRGHQQEHSGMTREVEAPAPHRALLHGVTRRPVRVGMTGRIDCNISGAEPGSRRLRAP